MLKKLKAEKYSFDIKTVIKTKANELKIINENLYVYDDSDSIKVYNCKTFKLKADLKLPLKGRIQRFDILENEVLILIYFGYSKLYYYKINLEEKQLTFMFYISETYNYCYDGIPKNSIVAIGTVGGSPRKLVDRKRFEEGFNKMVEVLIPQTIVVYGSANYRCFKEAEKQGIRVVVYKGKTSKYFEEVKVNE